METLHHVLACVFYVVGTAYYTVALTQLVKKLKTHEQVSPVLSAATYNPAGRTPF